MDKHFVLSKIKDYEAHLDNVAPLMESDDQLIMNELIREINNTCHVKIRGFSDLCDSYIKGAGSIIAKHINCFHSHLIRSALVFHLVGSKKNECGRVNGCEQIIWNLYNEYRNSVTFVDNSIMMEYDSAFAQLKSKKLLDQLVSLAQDPYLFSFFPQTMKMLARWRDPSMEKVIMGYFADPELKLLCLLAAVLMMLLSCNVNIAGGIHTDNTQSLYVFATILQYKFLIS